MADLVITLDPAFQRDFYPSGPMARRALSVLGDAWVSTAQRIVPVDTGALQATIRHDLGADSDGPVLLLIAGDADVDYAAHVELGTFQMAPQPFMRPALFQVAGIRSVA